MKIKAKVIEPFNELVKLKFEHVKPRMNFIHQKAIVEKHFNSCEKCIVNIPGKYIISFLKFKLKLIFKFGQTTLESFTYRLMKNCSFKELNYLSLEVHKFIN